MYGLVTEGEPFVVFARRENAGTGGLVIRFECKEGMGILGIRKSGRTDPAPSAAYEEEEIEPASLRAGRFVHVLPSGQRQSYALSRISAEVTNRMPYDRWIGLKPHTEYGFRYLVAPDTELDGTVASIRVAPEPAPAPSEPAPAPVRAADTPDPVPRFELPPVREPTGPIPVLTLSPLAETPLPVATRPAAPAREIRRAPPSLPPNLPAAIPAGMPALQTPMAPSIAENALRMMPKEVAIDHLKAEMQKVHVLQQRIAELEDTLRRSRVRERDLLDLLAKWDP